MSEETDFCTNLMKQLNTVLELCYEAELMLEKSKEDGKISDDQFKISLKKVRSLRRKAIDVFATGNVPAMCLEQFSYLQNFRFQQNAADIKTAAPIRFLQKFITDLRPKLSPRQASTSSTQASTSSTQASTSSTAARRVETSKGPSSAGNQQVRAEVFESKLPQEEKKSPSTAGNQQNFFVQSVVLWGKLEKIIDELFDLKPKIESEREQKRVFKEKTDFKSELEKKKSEIEEKDALYHIERFFQRMCPGDEQKTETKLCRKNLEGLFNTLRSLRAQLDDQKQLLEAETLNTLTMKQNELPGLRTRYVREVHEFQNDVLSLLSLICSIWLSYKRFNMHIAQYHWQSRFQQLVQNPPEKPVFHDEFETYVRRIHNFNRNPEEQEDQAFLDWQFVETVVITVINLYRNFHKYTTTEFFYAPEKK